MDDPEQKQRIKLWMAWFLVLAAVLVDLAEMGITWGGLIFLGGIASNVVAFGAAALFTQWLLMLGVKMSGNTKQFMLSIVVLIAELIPGFDAIPIISWGWSFGMILTIMMTRMEDRGQKVTILGALGRITSWASIPTGTGILLTGAILNADRRRKAHQKGEVEDMNQEVARNPERLKEIQVKYETRARKFKNRSLSRPERIESKFTQIKDGKISYKEGQNKEGLKEAAGNVLDLKDKFQNKASGNFGFKKVA